MENTHLEHINGRQDPIANLGMRQKKTVFKCCFIRFMFNRQTESNRVRERQYNQRKYSKMLN